MTKPLLPLLLTLFACGTDEDSGTDSAGGGGDTGPGEADELPWEGDCPAPSGFADGAHFEYEYNEAWQSANARTGSWAFDVSKGDDGVYTVNGTASSAGSNITYDEENVATYKCDGEGLWLLTLNIESVTVVTEEARGSLDYEFTAPALIMPLETEIGKKWTTTYDGTYTTEVGAKRNADAVYDWEIEAVDAVSAPAGDWNAERWVQTSQAGTPFTEWRVSGLGMVANSDSDATDVPE